MTTRTISEVVAKMVSVIEALTPDAEPTGRLFRYNRAPSRPLRPWLPVAGGAGMFRLFDITAGGRSDLGTNHIVSVLVTRPVTITIAYAAQPELVQLKERFELEALIDADAKQIRDALQRPAGLVGAGHQANMVTSIPAMDQGDERHWFQTLEIDSVFYASQRS